MLKMPPGASRISRLIGIDPGTNTLGVAELTFDVETMQVLHVTAKTLTAARETKDFWSNCIHGDRFGRINWLEDELVDIFHVSDPIQVAIESAFFNRMRPNAFEPLIQIKFAIQRAITRWTAWKPIYGIDPPTVKKAVGAKGNADKDAMKVAVIAYLKLHGIAYSGPVPIEELDEHSIDAIAVVIARFIQMLEELCLQPNSNSSSASSW